MTMPQDPSALCSEPGCDKPRSARGLCKGHYKKAHGRHWKTGDPQARKARDRAKTHKRRYATRLTDVTPAYEQELRARAKRCPLCNVKLVDGPYLSASKELDHMVPLNPLCGGTHTIGNVRIICRACNLARPKDGSDYTGPVTLWAMQPGFVPTVPRPKVATTCAHGVPRHRRCYTCSPRPENLRAADGRRAAQLRAEGWEWRDIADAIDALPTNAGLMARKYGEPAVIAQWPPDDPHCGMCGSALPRGGVGRPRKFCLDCRPVRVT